MSLADAMAKSPKVFPRVYVAMVQAGETGGFLDLVLAQIADFQAREKELRSKVMTAMLYPSILLVLALGVVVFLLTFFIPALPVGFCGLWRRVAAADAGDRRRQRCACGPTGCLWSWAWDCRLLSAHLVCLEKGRRAWEGLILRAPIVGPLVAQFAMARFCRMLGTLLGAGVPLVQALERGPQIHRQPDPGGCGGAVHRAGAARRPAGRQPGGLPGAFPGSVLEMISVAEESGKLDQELVRIANVTEGDLDRELKDGGGLCRAADAVPHRRVHRHDFHRHGDPDIHPAGLHQITSETRIRDSAGAGSKVAYLYS